MDLFGKQARQEQERLREKLNGLELRYSDIVAKHSAISEELRESKVFITTINSSNKLKAQYEDEKRDHYQKAAEYTRKSKEIDSKEAEILAAHEKKKATLTKEMRELEEKVSVIKAELADSQKRAKALEKEIQTVENKRDSVVAEVEKLKSGRSNAETALTKVQQKQSELDGAVDKLTRQHEALASSNLYLNQVVSRLNRQGDDDTVFASLEHDLHRFLFHDRTSGAMQVTLKASPLLLVVDLGYDSLNFAAVRAGLVSGDSEISLLFESRKIERGMGCSRFEALLAGWVWERFSAIHPRLNKSVKEQNGAVLSLPVARRLLALLCQGAPQGVVEETIIIDSEPYSASIPLLREKLVSVFLPLLGPDGELTGAIRRFLVEFKLSVDAIDRIVCMGWYGRLPLLSESLGEVLKRPVLVAEQLLALAPTVSRVTFLQLHNKQTDVNSQVNTSVVCSDLERAKAENKQHDRRHRVEWERIVFVLKAILVEKKKNERFERVMFKVDEKLENIRIMRIKSLQFKGGVIIDQSTNLIWTRDANIQGKLIWDDAMNWVKLLNYFGYSDWRLPTDDELKDFVDLCPLSDSYRMVPYNYFNEIGIVNCNCDFYWSCKIHSKFIGRAWGINMKNGA